jgi:hypothetical protein
VANRRVPIAVFQTGNTLAVVTGITNKERPATRTLWTHGVVEAFKTHIQLVRLGSSAL